MRVVVLSVYDLGRPPVDARILATRIGDQGHAVELHDLAVEPWPTASVGRSDAVLVSVPMHTASRLGIGAAVRARAENPSVRVAASGLYARLAGPSLEHVCDAVFGPDAVDGDGGLLAWLATNPQGETRPRPGAAETPPPTTPELPALENYSKLLVPGACSPVLAGAAAASAGCRHRCRHCPVPVGFGGRIRLHDVDAVLRSVDEQVDRGAGHISFTDPDFLNSPSHARRVVAEFSRRHPALSFDCTVKVEHIVAHPGIWAEMRSAGCLFVISAVECVDDEVLQILDKGHRTADAVAAVHLLREAGIEMRPSLLPFTPWTTSESLVALLDFVLENDLVGNVDPVHYGIRLLVPRGSLLLSHPAFAAHCGAFDPDAMAYRWAPSRPEFDQLQAELVVMAERAAETGDDPYTTYRRVRRAVFRTLGRDDPREAQLPETMATRAAPRMTESWFCCAEPTAAQSVAITCSRNELEGRDEHLPG